MIHYRTDDYTDTPAYACGITALPEGDRYHTGTAAALHADCPGCKPHLPQFGTPLSQLSGRPGHPGFDRFRSIAASWGHD